MLVARTPTAGGYLYILYSTFVDTDVSWQGTNYLYAVGWHPDRNQFVSASDDAILLRHGLIRAVGGSDAAATKSGRLRSRLRVCFSLCCERRRRSHSV